MTPGLQSSHKLFQRTGKIIVVSRGLAIRHDLTMACIASGVAAVLMCIASLAGLTYGAALYPEAELASQTGNDALNILLALPVLLGSMRMARQGKLMGLLAWIAALLYILYIYLTYTLGLPFGPLFLVYVGLVVLSTYTILGLIACIDSHALRWHFIDLVPLRASSVLLISFSLFFGLYQISEILRVLFAGTVIETLPLALAISDLTLQSPLLLLGGVLLWRGRPLGYLLAPALLLQLSLLLTGVALGAWLGSLLTGASFDGGLSLFLLVAALPIGLLAFFGRAANRTA